MNLFVEVDFTSVGQDRDILPFLSNDAWFQEAALERTTGELAELCQRMDRFDDKRSQLIQEFSSLLPLRVKILSHPVSRDRTRRLKELRRQASELKQQLQDAYNSFLRNSYRRYLTPETGCEVHDTLVQEMKDNLVKRFESTIKPAVNECSFIIDAFISRCHDARK